MPGVAHRRVALGRAELLLVLEEPLVAAVQEVELRVVEGRVVLLVALAVDVAEEARQIRAALPGELAVKDDDVALAAGLGLDGHGLVLQGVQEGGLDHLLGVEIDGAADVAGLVLVRVPAVDDLEVGHAVGELAADQPGQGLAADGLEVLVLAVGQRQDAGLAEVAGEVAVGRAAVDRGLDVRVGLGLGVAALERGRRRARGRAAGLAGQQAADVLEARGLAGALDEDGRVVDGRLGPLEAPGRGRELVEAVAEPGQPGALVEAELGHGGAGVGRAEEAGSDLAGARRTGGLVVEGEGAPEVGPGELAGRGLGRRGDAEVEGPLRRLRLLGAGDDVPGDEARQAVG